MTSETCTWAEIKKELEPRYGGLFDSCLASYDGVYTLSASEDSFSQLASAYPELARAVYNQTKQVLRVQPIKASASEASPRAEKKVIFAKGTQNTSMASVPYKHAGADKERFTLSAGASGIEEAILQPGSILAVPAYLLRFIPYVGAPAVLIAIALRQAYYRSGRDKGHAALYPSSGDRVTIEVERLLSMLGGVISRASFFRIMQAGKLNFFVDRRDSGHQVVDGQVRRLPNEYQYRGAMLTPGDAEDLTRFLEGQGTASPAPALATALETPRNQILTFPFRAAKPEDSRFSDAMSVPELVHKLWPKEHLSGEILRLCDQVSLWLTRPESFIAVPWYWFRKVLPKMGAELGGLYLMARTCTFTDWQSGQERDRFWLPGGKESLRAWTGSKVLADMLPSEEKSPRGRPRKAKVAAQSSYVRSWRENSRKVAQGYLTRIGMRNSDCGNEKDWQIRVGSTQLTEADAILRDVFYAFYAQEGSDCTRFHKALSALEKNSALGETLRLAARESRNVKGTGGICDFETLKQKGFCHFETFNGELIRHFETLRSHVICYFETLVEAGICDFETVIQILNRIKNPLFMESDSSTTEDTDHEKAVVEPVSSAQGIESSAWKERKPEKTKTDGEWKVLFEKIDPRKAAEIHKRGLTETFVAWVLYGASQEKIKDPLNLAVAKTLMGARVPEEKFVRLAGLGQPVLFAKIESVRTDSQLKYLGSAKWNLVRNKTFDEEEGQLALISALAMNQRWLEYFEP